MKPLSGGIVVGGSNVSAVRLSRGLAALGAKVMVCCGTAPEEARNLPDLLPWAKVFAVPVLQRESSWKYGLSFYRGFLNRLISHGMESDLISFHSGFSEYALFLGAIRRLFGKPVVYTAYCTLNASGGTNRLLSRLVRCSLNSIDQVITISGNVAKSMIAGRVQKKRVLRIPPPVDMERFVFASDGNVMRERLRVEQDEVVFLFIGSYKESKGLDILVQSFAEVLLHVPRARLIYTTEHESDAAEDNKRRVMSLVEKLPYREKVLHLGGVPRMEKLIASADVLVMPFLDTDGPSDYPIAIIEAMAFGKPVIATSVGGIPEIVSHDETGILVERNSVGGLARAMIELGKDAEKRKHFGINAAEKSKRFSLERIARETLEVYENACRR